MIRPRKSRGKSSGIAIVAVLISAVVFLGIIIAITGTLSLSSRQSTGDQRVTLEAQYAAESGLSRVLADAQSGYLNAWTGLLFRLVTPNTTQESDIKALALKFCNLPASTVFVMADGCKAVNSGAQVANRYDVFADYLSVSDYTKVSMPATVTLPTSDALESIFWSDVFSDGPSGKRFSQTVGTNVKYDVTFGLEAVSVKVVDGNYQFRVKPRDAISTGLYEANSKVVASRSSSRTFQDEYIIELRPPSFAYFLSLTNSQSQANADTTKPADDIYFDERTLLNGPVHTNGSYNFNGNTWLSDTVTSAGCTNPADLTTCKPRAKVDNGNALTFDANGNPEFLGYTNGSSARPEFVDRNFDDQTLRTTYTSDGGANPWKYTGKYNAGVVAFPTTSTSQENDAKTGGTDTTKRGILVPAGTLSPAELLLPKEQRPVYPQIILQATADNFDSTASTETKFNTITSSTPAADKRKQLIRIVNRITRTNCAAPPTGITISPPKELIEYPNPRFIDYTAVVTGQDDYSYTFAPTDKKVDSWIETGPSTISGSIVSTGKLTARYTTPSGYAMDPTPVKITATAGTFTSTAAILEVEADEPKLTLSASPNSFSYGGGTSTLSWVASGTGPFSYKIEESIDNGTTYTGVTTTTGASIPVTPETTTVYRVTATGPTGLIATKNLTVTVNPPTLPKVKLDSSPSSLPYGGPLTRLSWVVTGSYSAANPMVMKLTNNQNATVETLTSMTGFKDVPITETTRYVLAAVGPGGFDSDYEDVTVALPVAPVFTFDASPTSLPYGGGASKLTWTAATGATKDVTYTMTTVVGATTTGPSPIIGSETVGGTMDVTPTVTTTYNVTATGPGGSLTKTQTVVVAAPIAPDVTLTTSVPSLPFGGGSTTLGWSSSVGTGPITYQVESSTDGGVTWINIKPAGTAAGSQPVSLTNTTRYKVTATGGAGQTSIDSKDVTVAPPDPPAFTLKATPSSLPYLGGFSTLDWSGAIGTGIITYQLEQSTNAGANWTTLIGAGSSATSYPASLTATTRYRVTATGKVGANVVGTTPKEIDVTVAGPTSPTVAISRNPSSGTLVNGNNSTVLSWALTNTSPPASPTVTYRLEQKVGSGAWTTILGPNSTATSQTVTNLTATTRYQVTASSSAPGTVVGQSSLTLTVGSVGTPPNITSFVATPNSSTTTLNSVLSWTTINATSATLTRVSGTGTVPTLNVPTPSVASGNTPVTVPTTTYYELTAINAFGQTKRQVVVYIGTGTAPVVPVIPPPVINTFTASPPSLPYGGGSSTLTWNISNADSATISQGVGSVNKTSGTKGVTVPNATTVYELSATNAGGTTKRTVTVTVALAVVPTVTLNVPTTTYAYGGGTQTITWSATGTPTFAYQIQKSINGGSTWTDVVAAGSSLTSANVNTTQTTVYRAIAVGPGGTGYSVNKTVTVNPAVAPTVTLTPTPAVIAYGGGTTNLTWTASGTAFISYQLEKSTNGGTSWSTLIAAGSSLTSFNNVAVTSTTQFRVTATNLAGVNSDTKTVTVAAATPPTATLSILPNSFVYGGGDSNLTWGVSAGTGPTFTYKVDKSTNGTTWTNIVPAGSITTNLNNVNSSVTTQYRVTATGIGGNGEVIQNVTVAAAVAPTVNLTVPAATLPYGGGSAPLSWNSSAGTLPITYMLEASTNGGTTWVTLISAGSSAKTYSANPTETTVYRVTAKGPTGLEDSDQKTVNVTLPTPPTLTLKGLPLSHTYGGDESTLTWSATGTGPITYALEKSVDGGTVYNSVAISSSALTFKETVTKTTIYRVIATGVKGLKDSQTVTVTVGAPIPPTITSMTATPNLGIGGGTSTVKWTATGSAVITYKLGQSTNNGPYIVIEDNMTVTQRDVNITKTTKFKLIATNAGGDASDTAITTVAPPLETLMSLNKTGLAKDENDQASATSFDPSWDVSPVFSTNTGGGNPTIVKADYSTSVTPADTNVDTGLPTLKAEVVNDSGKIMLTINRLPKGTPSRTYTVRVTLTKNNVSVFADFTIELSKNSSYTTLRPRARLTDTCADGSSKISYLWPEFTDYMVLEDGTYYQRVYPSGQQSSAVLPTNVPATAPWIKQNYKFNGVIYAYGPAGIQGPPRTNLSDPSTAMPAVASFAKMTFASASDIIINGDLRYESPVCSTAPERLVSGIVTPATCVTTQADWKPNVLGIYTSSGNVNIRTQAKDPNTNTFKPLPNLAIQAITMASQGRVEVEGVLSTTASCPPLLNNASDKAGDLGSINIQGGLIQQSYGAFARIDNDATDKSWCGFDRTMTYDTRMRDPNRAPPSFPKADNAEWKTQIYLSSSPMTPLTAGKALPLTQGFSRNK